MTTTKQLARPARAPRATCPRSSPSARSPTGAAPSASRALLDKTLYEFLYHYWFRVEVEGIEHVPSTGGALLVSNHAGALPPDAAMIAKAIKTEHARPRPLHLTVEHFFKGYPGLRMLVAKLGGVPAHPANVHRLLYDEEQLVLVFPEGRKGTEKLYKDRYRLRRFGRGGFVESAMRAQGADRPGRRRRRRGGDAGLRPLNPLKKLTGLIYFPITPTFPLARPARRRRLPAGEVLHPLPGADPDRPVGRGAVGRQGPRADRRRGGPRAHPGGALRDARRPQVGLARMKRRVLITGLSSYWGGRLAQELETRRGRRGDHRRRARRPDAARWSAPSSSASGTQHALLRRIVHAAEIDTVDRHAPDRRLRDRPAARRARENVIGTMNILAACGGPDSPVTQGRLQVLRALLRLRARRPELLHRGDAAPARAAHAAGVRHRRGRGRRPGLRRAQPATSRSPRCASATASGRTCTPPTARCWACPPSRASSASTRATSSSTRTTSSARCTTRSLNDLPGIHNAAPDGVLALSEIAGLLGKPFAPLLPPWGTSLATRGDAAARHPRSPTRCASSCATAAGWTTASSSSPATASALTTRETVQAFAAALRLKPLRESGEAPYRYEREVEEFLRWSPSVRRDESGS